MHFPALIAIGAIFVVALFGTVQAQEAAGQDMQPANEGIELNLEAIEALKPKAPAAPQPDEAPEPQAKMAPEANLAGQSEVVTFAAGAPDLSEAERQRLAKLAGTLKDTELQVTIRAFASTGEDSMDVARRLALRRAINLRRFLVAHGIDGTRINLKPMSPPQEAEAPADRAELHFTATQ